MPCQGEDGCCIAAARCQGRNERVSELLEDCSATKFGKTFITGDAIIMSSKTSALGAKAKDRAKIVQGDVVGEKLS